jgi:DNA repair exonuclease SbcCD ATPase subunit
MRNDAHDELHEVPSLSAGRDRDVPYPAPELESVRRAREGRVEEGRSRQKRRAASTWPLWLLVVVLFVALGGLGWWSLQQIMRLETQLVATQESFARISEDAAGRLQDISGKVVATESSVTTESEAVKLRIRQLEKQAIDLAEQQRALTTEQKSLQGKQGNHDQRFDEQGKRLETVATDLRSQQGTTTTLQSTTSALSGTVETLTREQAGLQASLKELRGSLAGVAELSSRIDALGKEVAALKQRGDVSPAVTRLEQEMLVLRSELDNRPAPRPQPANTAEFDSFRAQMTRTISALQSQIANLQEQIDAR